MMRLTPILTVRDLITRDVDRLIDHGDYRAQSGLIVVIDTSRDDCRRVYIYNELNLTWPSERLREILERDGEIGCPTL